MEMVTLFEWAVGGAFVGVNAYRRYNTPISNRSSTTFQNFITFFIFYLISVLVIYVFIGAIFDGSPEAIGAIYGFMSGQMDPTLPEELANLSAPMVSALFLTILLPSLPWLSRYDRILLNNFWDRGHIPNHVHKMATAMRRAPYNFSPGQVKQLRDQCMSLEIDFNSLELDSNSSLDYRWARINILIKSIVEWNNDDSGRLRRFMLEHSGELNELVKMNEEINKEFKALKNENEDKHVLIKLERPLDKMVADLFRRTTVFISRATCIAELTESGRSARLLQLGFEGGSKGERLSSSQILGALLAILFSFLIVSFIQELTKPAEYRKFGGVLFMTFMMFFSYGAALMIALDLKCRTGMGYNELTRQRSLGAYLLVGIYTALSWLVVIASYRYITTMLSGLDSDENISKVLENLGWSYPYALQSLALAVSISWILDYHQSRGISGKLSNKQRLFDVGVAMVALGVASIIAWCWMEGWGWFEGYGTKDPNYRGTTPIGWFILKGLAVGAIVSWLVPMWFNLNRLKSPDQIAGRLIMMNNKGLSNEIRSLEPNELVEIIAAVGASVAAIDDDVSRSEKDVYQIICSHLAGLPSSDIDINSAENEFDICLAQIERAELDLEERLRKLDSLPLLASLMPYIASSIAFADGVYLEKEKEVVEQIKQYTRPTVLAI